MSDQGLLIQNYVSKRIAALLREGNDANISRELAILRRGVGKAPGEYPEIFGILFDSFPEELMSKNGQPTKAEWAVSTALCLFAVHQQGMDPHTQAMSRKGAAFGKSARKLVTKEDEMESVRRHFNQVLSSQDIRGCTHYLRNIVQMMKTKQIPIDYPQLAKDLYWFQCQEGRFQVRLLWGQDFYRNQSVNTAEASMTHD